MPKSEEEEYDLDTESLALIAEEQKELEKELGHGPISIEEAREILSKVPGSCPERRPTPARMSSGNI
jgi:hypothetical protein